ncbi:MAG: hypothetical protein IBJ07_12195 [Rhizobiaceae bacterium]|nr:hypothetical protein [Rhizobiaceae bacterium]
MTKNTPRGRMSPKRRHHIFSENCTGHNVAPCCICGQPVHRNNDEWIIEHKRALGLLGRDVNTNCAPAHVACANEKTHTQDLPAIRKAKRQAEAGRVRSERSVHDTRAFGRPADMVYDWKSRSYRFQEPSHEEIGA